MKLINSTDVLLQEKEWKPKKPKKGEPEPPKFNPEIMGEATVVLSLDSRLKKGDKVIVNRTGLLNVEIKGKKYILMEIQDIKIKP
jgi:hypothetical protein